MSSGTVSDAELLLWLRAAPWPLGSLFGSFSPYRARSKQPDGRVAHNRGERGDRVADEQRRTPTFVGDVARENAITTGASMASSPTPGPPLQTGAPFTDAQTVVLIEQQARRLYTEEKDRANKLNDEIPFSNACHSPANNPEP